MEDKKLEKEILNCKNCNVTNDKLLEYPIGTKDKLIFENLCLHHKIIVVKKESQKGTIKIKDVEKKIDEEIEYGHKSKINKWFKGIFGCNVCKKFDKLKQSLKELGDKNGK